jgi:hypothetical protein
MRQWVLPPGVEILWLEFTEGIWGGKAVEPDEEIRSLTHWFLQERHVTYPVAIWAGPLDTLFDGGVEPRENPFHAHVLMTNWTPDVVITDGHGIVRFHSAGNDTYAAFKRTIDLLIVERAKERRVPASVPTTVPAGATPEGMLPKTPVRSDTSAPPRLPTTSVSADLSS